MSLSPIFLIRKLIFSCLCFLILNGCAATSPNIVVPKQEPPLNRLKHLHPRVVLVLGSGSARGFAHAGVLKVLEENHVPIDMIVGTSAGSIVGSLYADKPSAASLQQLFLKTSRDEVIDFSIFNIGQGLVSGNQLQNFLIKNMHARSFHQLKIPFLAVATNLQTGKIHVFGSGPIAPAVNASSAAPPFFRPVKLYGQVYIDGGLVDPVAVDIAKRFHPEIIIAVSLNYSLSKTPSMSSPSVFFRGMEMMLIKLNEYTAANAQVVINPRIENTNMFDGEKRIALMHAGEVAANQALPKIKKLLNQYHIKN